MATKTRSRTVWSPSYATLVFMLLLSTYLQTRSSSQLPQAPLYSLSCIRNMHKRKRPATIMDTSIENSTAPASPSTTAGSDPSGSKDGPSRGLLQPRPNPPAKRVRPSGQPDRDKISSGLCKAQEVIKIKPSASNAGAAAAATTVKATSLPPEIWRLVGQKVDSFPLLCHF
jgi:hypothetical protein